MTEPSIAEQLLMVVLTVTCLFIILLLIASSEQKAKAKKKAQEEHDRMIIEVYQQGRNQFNNIARMNIRNCDRKFTYDTEKPEGLREELLALPYPKG
jgi:flagellar basal body-associated protein FliL